jgi:catechol 1,2-dioxygenase
MNNDRREFIKWLSVTPLLAGSACTGNNSNRDRTGESPGPGTKKAPALEKGGYVANEDQLRMARTRGYSSNLPADSPCRPTGPDVLGPFHRAGAPRRTIIADENEPGERLKITGRVLLHDCKTPVVGALLDIWHADIKGRYDNHSANYRLRGQVTTDARGYFEFITIKPGRYELDDSTRPSHVHFNVSYPGCHPLTTQLYFKGDPYLKPSDPCDTCNSGDKTLIVGLTRGPVGKKTGWTGVFNIYLAKA